MEREDHWCSLQEPGSSAKHKTESIQLKYMHSLCFPAVLLKPYMVPPWQRIELECWVTGIPVSCSRVWMGPARQTLALSRSEPSDPGTILCVCLRERPTRPFEEQHACRFGQRDSVEWTWLWMSERERERERRGERWVGRGFYKTGCLLSSKCWNPGLSQPMHDFFFLRIQTWIVINLLQTVQVCESFSVTV